MTVLKELIALLHIDAETAERVRHEMDCSGLDFSQCSVREFNACARECYVTLTVVRADMAATSAARAYPPHIGHGDYCNEAHRLGRPDRH